MEFMPPPGKRITLLLVDPQIDFHPGGSLAIPTANEDSERIASFIHKHLEDIDQIFISLDSHHRNHIAHGIFWIKPGHPDVHPPPFTIISHADVDKLWTPRNPYNLKHCLEYTRNLEAIEGDDKYKLIIWPEHCLIGSPGHAVVPSILKATHEWEGRHKDKSVIFHMKAEVPLDKSTEMNTALIRAVSKTDL
eukprot:gene10738-22435_t